MDERLSIVGSGTVASGLAATAAQHGEVTLVARSEAAAARAQAAVRRLCERMDNGRSADRVRVVSGYAAGVAGATFVLEAIVEDLDAKRDLFAQLGADADAEAVLGTTTSSLSVAALARASGRPQRFVGFHVFNPVTRMPLVELAFPALADARTRERARALAERLDKQAVEVPDTPGFVVNRLLFPFLFDAVRFHEENGMAPGDVDLCMTLGAGHPMGPLALLDFVGLDVAMAVGESLGVEVPGRLRELVAGGAVGKKAGRGFYDYG